MPVLEMDVTDGDGLVEDESIGKIITVENDPYTFYANPGTDKETKVDVQMVMPIGGSQSGLFRQPRVGERVLVAQELMGVSSYGYKYYLMGFVPDSKNAFYNAAEDSADTSVDNLGGRASQQNPVNIDEFSRLNGMALRYERDTNKNQPKENDEYQNTAGGIPYSEIGFYNKKAKWPKGSLTNNPTESDFDRLDTLNIQSSGDIEHRSQNYHLLKAKRFEILAGDNALEITQENRLKNALSDNWDASNVPLGDVHMEDPLIHSGDVHIRASDKVIIKAAREIRLQVGRTTLIVDDGGFKVVTQKINSGVGLSYDTVFSMNSREGISMYGQSVDIKATRKLTIADSWGGSFNIFLGMVTLKGKQISQNTYDSLAAKFTAGVNTTELAMNISQGFVAAKDKSATKTLNWVGMVGKSVMMLTKDVEMWIHGVIKPWRENANNAKQMVANADENDPVKLQNSENARSRERNARLEEEIAYHESRPNPKDLPKLEPDYQLNPRTMNFEDINASRPVDPDEAYWDPDVVEDKRALLQDVPDDQVPGAPQFASAADAVDCMSALIGLEPFEQLNVAVDMALSITETVYAALDVAIEDIYRTNLKAARGQNEEAPLTLAGISTFKDMLNMSALTIDNSIIESASILQALSFPGASAKLSLNSSGDIVIKAASGKNLYATESKMAAVPTSIFSEHDLRLVKLGAVIAKTTTDIAKIVSMGMAIGRKVKPTVEKL
jgi:hypothetical protein